MCSLFTVVKEEVNQWAVFRSLTNSTMQEQKEVGHNNSRMKELAMVQHMVFPERTGWVQLYIPNWTLYSYKLFYVMFENSTRTM